MSDNPVIAVAVVEQQPAGESVPVPTPEQEHRADEVFSRPVEHHAAVNLLGMVASVQVLHDLAGEIFRRNSDEEIDEFADEELPKPDAAE
jgi:hypothetical protein